MSSLHANSAHSRLLEEAAEAEATRVHDLAASTPAPAPAAHPDHAKHLTEARRKFTAVLNDEVLDYKHHHAVLVENSVQTLMKIFGNVLESPLEPKFRRLKATNKVFARDITAMRGAEHLMQLAGWRSEVSELERFWTFDGQPGSLKLQVLAEDQAALEKAMGTIHEKAARKRREEGGKKQAAAEEKERILLQLKDDAAMRALAPPIVAAPAIALPSSRQASGAVSPSGPGLGGEEDED